MNSKINKNQYQCSMCHDIFYYLGSNEEAINEMKHFFGNVDEEDRCIVCDDCFQKIRPDKNPLELDRYKSSKNYKPI